MFWTNKAAIDPPHIGGKPLIVVRSAQARSMRLSVDPKTRSVRLMLPSRAALGPAFAWAETRRGWAEAQLARMPRPQPIVPGMVLVIAGDEVLLDWNDAYSRIPRRCDASLKVGGPLESLGPRLIRYLKAEAKRVMTAETRALADAAAITVSGVGIGDPVSRWGSCSAAGAIRYSWRLILAPGFVRQAIIAHEVAHRVHMNHGKAFHALAAQLTDGDPKAAHRWLKAYGAGLHSFGEI